MVKTIKVFPLFIICLDCTCIYINCVKQRQSCWCTLAMTSVWACAVRALVLYACTAPQSFSSLPFYSLYYCCDSLIVIICNRLFLLFSISTCSRCSTSRYSRRRKAWLANRAQWFWLIKYIHIETFVSFSGSCHAKRTPIRVWWLKVSAANNWFSHP